MNPVLVREWKSFFRGKAPFYFLIFYGALHLLLFLGVTVPVLSGGAIYDGEIENSGRLLAGRLFGAQLLLIMLSFPSLTVKLMTYDKDNGTQQLLQIIPYANWKIICWKLAVSIILWVLLILIISPLYLFSFSMGGISLKDLARMIGITLLFVISCGVTGLLFASVVDKPVHSLSMTYLSVFAFVFFSGYLYYPDSIIMRFLEFSF